MTKDELGDRGPATGGGKQGWLRAAGSGAGARSPAPAAAAISCGGGASRSDGTVKRGGGGVLLSELRRGGGGEEGQGMGAAAGGGAVGTVADALPKGLGASTRPGLGAADRPFIRATTHTVPVGARPRVAAGAATGEERVIGGPEEGHAAGAQRPVTAGSVPSGS